MISCVIVFDGQDIELFMMTHTSTVVPRILCEI